MSQALASLRDRHTTVATLLEQARTRLAQVIPASTGLMPSRAIAVVLDALVRNPALLDCQPKSIVQSVIHASELGLELGSPLGEAYLVPFSGKATMMIGYRGFVRLIRGGPKVTIVKGVLVREGDQFAVDEGANELHHVLAPGTTRARGKVVYAYSRVYYTDGSSQFEVMDIDELDKIKTEALSKDRRGASPWRKHEGEMYKKCPLRRQAKWLDLSPTGRRGVEIDELNAMQRGEYGTAPRDGFTAERTSELKEILIKRDAKVDVIDADFEEEVST